MLSAWLLSVLGNRLWNKKLFYASVYLFHKQSFRLPQSAGVDRLIVLKSYLKAVRALFKMDKGMKTISEGEIGVLDSSFNGMEDRVKYLKFYNVSPAYFFSRGDLSGNMGFLSGVFGFTILTSLLFFFWPVSFLKNRTNYALLFRESIEWMNIISYCKRNNIRAIYMFSIYEKDSNLLAFLLMKKGITVNKITSEVPVSFANKIILTDNLFLCFNYQMEEVKMLSETLFYKKIATWMPEMQLNYLDLYDKKKIRLPANVIGFYSGACWLRKKLDHTILETIGSYDAEEKVLKDLLEYVQKKSNLRLMIFLHPIEKRNKSNLDDAMKYYSAIINEDLKSKVEFHPSDSPGVFAFDKINIGVSLFSTIMFERLSLGFKCILNPVDKPDFPIANSPFRNICAYSKSELFEKLDKNINLSMEEYLRENNIKNYLNTKVSINYKLN